MSDKARTHLEITLPYCERWGYHSLLDVALMVRMTASGATDRSMESQKRDVLILRHVLELWRNSFNQTYERFDTAVKELLLSALEEHRQFLQRTKLQKVFDDTVVSLEEDDTRIIRKFKSIGNE